MSEILYESGRGNPAGNLILRMMLDECRIFAQFEFGIGPDGIVIAAGRGVEACAAAEKVLGEEFVEDWYNRLARVIYRNRKVRRLMWQLVDALMDAKG